MSDWHSVEAPNAPEGIADIADDTAPTRVDETTGDTPASKSADDYVDAPETVNDEVPIAVKLVGEMPVRLIRPNRFNTAKVGVDTILRQILGEDRNRHSAILRNLSSSATLYIARDESSDTQYMEIAPGDSIVLENTAAVYVAASATLTVALLIESYA